MRTDQEIAALALRMIEGTMTDPEEWAALMPNQEESRWNQAAACAERILEQRDRWLEERAARVTK